MRLHRGQAEEEEEDLEDVAASLSNVLLQASVIIVDERTRHRPLVVSSTSHAQSSSVPNVRPPVHPPVRLRARRTLSIQDVPHYSVRAI